MKISPLAPADPFHDLPDLKNIALQAFQTGEYNPDRPNLLLVKCKKPYPVAALFTQSQIKAAPVEWSINTLNAKKQNNQTYGYATGLITTAGNANAFTGKIGRKVVTDIARTAAQTLKCKQSHILQCATGVIGVPPKSQKICNIIKQHYAKINQCDWKNAAQAIMTTDTFPKCATQKMTLEGKNITITGIAKGSGMIAPNMATMLAFIFTDANIEPKILYQMLKKNNEKTFNAITVDGDTSTNDTVIAFATGDDNPIKSQIHKKLFEDALRNVMAELAEHIIRDGEGVQKLIKIHVNGTQSFKQARAIGRIIANSPLVKTAIAGEDPNWGRIIMAIGNAPTKIEKKYLSIKIGNNIVAQNGEPKTTIQSNALKNYMKNNIIHIEVTAGKGKQSATVTTCDLTHGYIDINAHYTT